jgi:hypothetical protein
MLVRLRRPDGKVTLVRVEGEHLQRVMDLANGELDMAGDWIKVEINTPDKPEVLAMAESLEIDPDAVFGKLFRVWSWFDQQSLNGNAGSVTGNALKRFIDRLVALQGFADCMQKAGWLSDSGVPNFDRHNGESAKKRALTNKRVKRLRNDDSVTKALPEKRREEKKEKHIRTSSKRGEKTPLPEGFGLSERVIDWAKREGFGNLQAHLDNFRLTAAANDYRYADWDAALMKAIRGNWARVGDSKATSDQFAGAL